MPNEISLSKPFTASECSALHLRAQSFRLALEGPDESVKDKDSLAHDRLLSFEFAALQMAEVISKEDAWPS